MEKTRASGEAEDFILLGDQRGQHNTLPGGAGAPQSSRVYDYKYTPPAPPEPIGFRVC